LLDRIARPPSRAGPLAQRGCERSWRQQPGAWALVRPNATAAHPRVPDAPAAYPGV